MPITIPLSKIKITLMSVVYLGLSALGIWIYVYYDLKPGHLAVILQYGGAAMAVFFLIIGLRWSLPLFSNKPGLVISREGIVDNCSDLKVGLIRWKNIERISCGLNSKIIFLHVNNMPEILRRRNLYTRILMGSDMTVMICSLNLKIGFKELEELLKSVRNINDYSHPTPLKRLPIIIPLSKTKTTVIFIIYALIIAFGIFIYLYFPKYNLQPDPSSHNLFDFIDTPKKFEYLGMFMTMIGGILFFNRLRWVVGADPALMITYEGIIDNCSTVKAGLIPWKNITGVGIHLIQTRSGQDQSLVIKVNNMSEILNNKNIFTKFLAWLYGVSFNSVTFKMGLDELRQIIEEHWEERTRKDG